MSRRSPNRAGLQCSMGALLCGAHSMLTDMKRSGSGRGKPIRHERFFSVKGFSTQRQEI